MYIEGRRVRQRALLHFIFSSFFWVLYDVHSAILVLFEFLLTLLLFFFSSSSSSFLPSSSLYSKQTQYDPSCRVLPHAGRVSLTAALHVWWVGTPLLLASSHQRGDTQKLLSMLHSPSFFFLFFLFLFFFLLVFLSTERESALFHSFRTNGWKYLSIYWYRCCCCDRH